MRILLITPNLYGPDFHEGVNHIVRRLVEHLTRKNVEVVVIATSLESCSPEIGEYGEKIFFIPIKANRWWHRFSFWFLVTKQIRNVIDSEESSPDVALVLASASLFLGPRVLILRSILGARMVLSISGLNRPVFGVNWFVGKIKTMVGSPFLLRWFPEATVTYPLTPTHLNVDTISQTPRQAHKPFSILFLGSLQKVRGLEYLLKGLALARQQTMQPLRLTLGINHQNGENDPELRQWITDFGLTDIVSVYGILDINEAYQTADVLIIPRQQPIKMSFPVRILEALSFNVPVIVTSMCEMGHLVEGCGLEVDPKNPEDLARTIVRLAEDPDLYEQLSANCARVLKKYDPDKTLETIYSVLRDVAQKRELATETTALKQSGSP